VAFVIVATDILATGGKVIKITDALCGEHAVLYSLFDHLEQTLKNNYQVAPALSAIFTAAVVSYAHLEDELLFTALDPHLGQMGPLQVVRMEHSEIEHLLEVLLPQAKDADGVARLLLQAINIARLHFNKEEQVLFVMAQQVLGSEFWINPNCSRWSAKATPASFSKKKPKKSAWCEG
jgi:hemerythrin-like domain-containing protein